MTQPGGEAIQPGPTPVANLAPITKPAPAPAAAEPAPIKVNPPPVKKVTKNKKRQSRPRPVRRVGGYYGLPRPLDIAPKEVVATNVDKATLHKAIKMGFQVITSDEFSGLGVTVTRLLAPPALSAVAAQDLLQTDLQSGAVGFNHRYRLYRAAKADDQHANGRGPKTCKRKGCFGQSAIGWNKALARCAKDVKIGVIDTGIEADHPVFANRRIEFATTASNGKRTSSESHGTGVLALLAGDPKSAVHGLIPDSKFVVADIFSSDDSGEPVTDTVSLLHALELLGTLDDVAIVNMSLSGPRDPPVENAIAKLSKKGMIFVAAAGNGGPGAPASYPANYEQVIAVTAVSQSQNAFRHANHGDYIDLAAPGVRIWTALPDGRYGFQTGTSFAVPYVTAAVAAIYKTVAKQDRTKATILAQLPTLDLGVANKDKVYGNGLLLAPPGCSPSVVSWAPSVRRDVTTNPISFPVLASQ